MARLLVISDEFTFNFQIFQFLLPISFWIEATPNECRIWEIDRSICFLHGKFVDIVELILFLMFHNFLACIHIYLSVSFVPFV